MLARPVIAVAALLVALAAIAAAIVVYDHGQQDKIGKGVTIGGVDVGGLKRDAAEAKLRQEILAPLNREVTVDHGSRRWRLTAREAKVATNLEATVTDALERSREGNLLQAHLARGHRPEARRPPPARGHVLRRGGHPAAGPRPQVRQPPGDERDDQVRRLGPDDDAQPRRPGGRRHGAAQEDQRGARLADASRRFSATTHHVKPTIDTEKLIAQNATTLVVNREAFKLTVFKNLKKVKSYSVAIGAVGRDTPGRALPHPEQGG